MRRILILLLITLAGLIGKAQDPHFTQYFSSGVYLNPAFAGFEGSSRVSTAYQVQWPELHGSFNTLSVSYDQFLKPLLGGISVRYLHDAAGEGTLITQEASGAYAPSLYLFEKILLISPAIELGWIGKSLDWDKLTFGDMIDPRYGFVYETSENSEFNNSVNQFNLNAGVLFSHHNLVYGVSFQHLNRPHQGFTGGGSKLPIKYALHFSYVAELSDNLKMSPSIIYLHQQDFTLILPSISFSFRGVKAGLATNSGNSAILMLGYSSKRIAVGYSYDRTISSLSRATSGSHELSLVTKFNFKNQEGNRKGIEQVNF